ncbi:MAG: hypothetical protein H6732_20235 [Alphaproteobacteria bacterium]|nr:hypothetical protein [Alphaproteobacteria bacterium]
MTPDDELETWRARVAHAHEQVVAGDYDSALATFVMALPALRARLGAAHPEVVELGEDVDTLRSMQCMADLAREVGGGPAFGPGGPVRGPGKGRR